MLSLEILLFFCHLGGAGFWGSMAFLLMVPSVVTFRFRNLLFVAEGLSVDHILGYSVLVRYLGPFGFALFFINLDLFLSFGIHVCPGAYICSFPSFSG